MRCRYLALPLAFLSVLAACSDFEPLGGSSVAFWRPISEPNLLLPADTLQKKLEFDMSQCHCSVYPTNASRDEVLKFQPDKQRLVATGMTVGPDEEDGSCQQQPSLIVTECMRQRGWEPTTCSGRLPLPKGGSLCGTYVQPE